MQYPARPRSVIDYSLARRALVASLRTAGLFASDVCDADTYLLRAAKHHGEATERVCPICPPVKKSTLTHVTYVYGDELGPYSGRIKASDELPAMALEYGGFRVYVVEVCAACRWNHLHLSYTLGDGRPRIPVRVPNDSAFALE